MPIEPELLFGRDESLHRVGAAVARAASGTRSVVLVTGEGGIGKTSLARGAVRDVEIVGWGTCVRDAAAPGHWPWTQALDAVAHRIGPNRARELAGDDAGLLAVIGRSFGAPAPGVEGSARDRLLLMDAVSRWLDRIAAEARPVVIVLDDLQWADDSSLALLEFVGRAPEPAGVCLIGCYRPDELPATARDRLDAVATAAVHVELAGLDRVATAALVDSVVGPVTTDVVDDLHRRAGGHPVFTRELALLAAAGGDSQRIPTAVRDAIDRRFRRLPEIARRVLHVAALGGNELHTDLVARALDVPAAVVQDAVGVAARAGILLVGGGEAQFAHDLFREAIVASVPTEELAPLHRRLGEVLEERIGRGGDVSPAEVAHHFAAAMAVDGTSRASRWALAAAERDRAALAFREAAAHLRRWRSAVAETSVAVDDGELFEVLVAEADALARAGSVVDARGLLRMARDVARRSGAPDRLGRVALALTDFGAQFSARRDDVVNEVEEALRAVAGSDVSMEARLTATMARELQHSVAADRPRAGPLSEHALRLARNAGDPHTLVTCLLARHDVLWTPGSAAERVEIAGEIVSLCEQIGDDERRAEALLLLANALLETGSAAFAPALESCLVVLDRLGQVRHRYIAETRRGALLLLAGDLDAAAVRIEAAAALGARIREPDTGNVRMSQQLELVRARSDADELRDFARSAVAHWTGAPVHAHAVAAGFLARAGDLDAARRHVATVLDLGTWRADTSYLWSVFVRELAVAAIALDDRSLCEQLLHDVEPVAGTCGVNGAVVAFAGSHAHIAALLADHLGLDGSRHLEAAAAVYRRLGAETWLDELTVGHQRGDSRCLRRRGSTWEVTYEGERGSVPASKGMADIATLLAHPNRDFHVLDLAGTADRSGRSSELADPQALKQYRRRLADLDEDLAEASAHNDVGRHALLETERDELLAELRRVTTRRTGSRVFANYPAERARKAVAGRIRDAIRRLAGDLPAFAAHLDATIVTGTSCRYRSDLSWSVEDEARPPDSAG